MTLRDRKSTEGKYYERNRKSSYIAPNKKAPGPDGFSEF